MGWGVGGIPFEALDRYADRYGIEDFEEFRTLMRAADDAYLEVVRKKDDSGRPQGKAGRGGRRS